MRETEYYKLSPVLCTGRGGVVLRIEAESSSWAFQIPTHFDASLTKRASRATELRQSDPFSRYLVSDLRFRLLDGPKVEPSDGMYEPKLASVNEEWLELLNPISGRWS